MSGSLHRVKNWPERASQARYNATRLAKSCGVSLRQLERFFLQHKRVCPKQWLHELRDQRALELLKESFNVKEVADALGYRDTPHFSHDFKKLHGQTPTQFARSRADVSRFDI